MSAPSDYKFVSGQAQASAEFSKAMSRIAELLDVLLGIAKQHIGDEIEDPEHADWQGGYEECVKRARAAVGK